jgi:peptidoglycan biosynthesis protein MviN/MurJ (putative lipid II flippase)
MTHVGKLMMLAGALLLAIGALAWIAGRAGFRGLPGDIQYQSRNVRIYFPVVTCIVLSLLLTALLWIWQWWSRR